MEIASLLGKQRRTSKVLKIDRVMDTITGN